MPPIPNLRVPLSVFVCEKELERAWFVGKIGLPFPFSQATLVFWDMQSQLPLFQTFFNFPKLIPVSPLLCSMSL